MLISDMKPNFTVSVALFSVIAHRCILVALLQLGDESIATLRGTSRLKTSTYSPQMFALWQFPPHSITLHLADSSRRWHPLVRTHIDYFRCFALFGDLALITQHRELATTIASFVSDESFILILTSLSWDCLYRNRLHRTELLIYLHSLREYRWTIWREEEQRREIEADMDRMFGPSCPTWY